MIDMIRTEICPLPPPLCGNAVHYQARSAFSAPPEISGLAIAEWSFDELLSLTGVAPENRAAFAGQDAAIHPGGWQSWSAGWELMGRERLPRKVALIPDLIKLTNRDREQPPGKTGWITGHFITYLRWGDCYLCIASQEGGALAPATFYINRKKQRIRAEVFAPGKTWQAGETAAVLHVFFARGFFAFKDALKTLYRQEEAFQKIDFLRGFDGAAEIRGKRNLPGGYASWYNHYTEIHESIILEDLQALSQTENLLKLRYIDRTRPIIFQIDDGWQRAVGEWEISEDRFPHGLACIAQRIEAAGFVPGLWLAPFLVTRRARIFRERPDWLLRAAGKPVVAGFNHLWDK
ncbi:MAG: alpha-galactosidase, partial [Treponema sp.]|nr:alpha-galactosidase [Treponema sp.]